MLRSTPVITSDSDELSMDERKMYGRKYWTDYRHSTREAKGLTEIRMIENSFAIPKRRIFNGE